MATINYSLDEQARVVVATWTTLTEDDTATPVRFNAQAGISAAIQITGDFGGGDVSLEGSIDGTNYEIITDLRGDAITLSAAGLVDFSTAAVWLRPRQPTGTDADVDVYISVRV